MSDERIEAEVRVVAEALISEGCGSGWAYPRAHKIIAALDRLRDARSEDTLTIEADCRHGYRAAGGTAYCPVCEAERDERWTIHVCEDHRRIDCEICGVFDVIKVMPVAALAPVVRPSQEAGRKAAAEALQERWPSLGLVARGDVHRHPSKREIADVVLAAYFACVSPEGDRS